MDHFGGILGVIIWICSKIYQLKCLLNINLKLWNTLFKENYVRCINSSQEEHVDVLGIIYLCSFMLLHWNVHFSTLHQNCSIVCLFHRHIYIFFAELIGQILQCHIKNCNAILKESAFHNLRAEPSRILLFQCCTHDALLCFYKGNNLASHWVIGSEQRILASIWWLQDALYGIFHNHVGLMSTL